MQHAIDRAAALCTPDRVGSTCGTAKVVSRPRNQLHLQQNIRIHARLALARQSKDAGQVAVNAGLEEMPSTQKGYCRLLFRGGAQST